MIFQRVYLILKVVLSLNLQIDAVIRRINFLSQQINLILEKGDFLRGAFDVVELISEVLIYSFDIFGS